MCGGAIYEHIYGNLANYATITYSNIPLTHYDQVKVASHKHGSILGVEVEVVGREEGREVSSRFLWLL